MKTAAEIETLLELSSGTLTITERNGERTYSPGLSAEQLARIKMATLGPDFVVPAWRIRTVLRRHGLLEQVESMIAEIPEPPRIVIEEQMRSSNFMRGHPIIAQIGLALGLSSNDLDEIFVEADLLT